MHELIFLQRKYRKKYRILNSKWIIDVYCISLYYNFIYMFYETYIVQNSILLKIIILIPHRWTILANKIYEKIEILIIMINNI